MSGLPPEMSITSKLPERSLVLKIVGYLLPAGRGVCAGPEKQKFTTSVTYP
jgi:hypothetical protein